MLRIALVVFLLALWPYAARADSARLTATRLPGSDAAYVDVGSAQPAVVFQSGLGDGWEVWRRLAAALHGRVRILLHSRSSASEATSDPAYSPCARAREQHALVQARHLQPPYVLVGHSLGGLYQYAYAKLYPDEVAGLILLDATHPDHFSHLQQEAPGAAALLTTARLLFGPVARREFDAQAACNAELARLPTPRIPVRVFVRAEFSAQESRAFAAVSRALADDWKTLTGAAAVERLSGTDHYLQKSHADEVAAAILALAAK